ncbi:hypothetical protein GF342_02710 [Candidatus Woesearchaeota archaeon]|nr:hypothetical protein [Candidatus Woesearchaeota archaeon]
MVKVLIDTSFLIKCAEYGIDIFDQVQKVVDSNVEFCVIKGTAQELDAVEPGGGKMKTAVRVARLFLKKMSVLVPKEEGLVDDLIVDYASHHKGVIVATHDTLLKKRVLALPCPVIILRQRKYAQLVLP